MALGADRSRIVRLVLRGAFRTLALGVLLGAPLAIAAGRLMSSQLYGVTGWDPLSLSIAMAALAACAFVAAIIPAARASAIDPLTALRVE
jgi:ABC-type antimicrobial peptide transport system permease subunit